MVAQFRYRDVAEIMGSWPFADVPSPASNPQLQPNSLYLQASIIGTRRAPANGYLVGGLSLTIYVDVGGVPTAHTVTFPTGGGSGLTTDHFTLAEVLARFQASTPALPANTAQNFDNFILLRSPTLGQNSHVRLESILGAEGVFQELGLLPGYTAVGGDIAQVQHFDPSRQLAGHGQLSMGHGDTFRNDVFNRGLMQVAINAGRNTGTLDYRRVAVRRAETFAGSGAASVQLNLSAPAEGVYTGPVATPTSDQLLDQIVVLDDQGNEFTQEVQENLNGQQTDLSFTLEANTNRQLVNSASFVFVVGDVADNVYVVATNLVAAAVLNNVPLKVLERISATQAVVQAVNPTTGAIVQITETGRTGSRIRIHQVRAEIDGFFQDAGLTTRAEQQQVAVSGGAGTITRVEAGNRIYVPTANFTTATQIGDRAVIASASPSSPFSNNGTYRVKRVIDAFRVELMNFDCSPVILNPDTAGGLGSVTVTTDGSFWRAPYVRFAAATAPNLAAGRGAIPQTGQNFQIVYMVGRSMRAALDAEPFAFTGSMRREQEASAAVKHAIMRLAGPSVTSFSEIIHGNFDLSLEKLDFRMDREHYESNGRHSTIRPDIIDMFPNVAGVTHILRGTNLDLNTDAKFQFLNSAGLVQAAWTSGGGLILGDASSPTYDWGSALLDVVGRRGNVGVSSAIRVGTFAGVTNIAEYVNEIHTTSADPFLTESLGRVRWRWDNGVATFDNQPDYMIGLVRDSDDASSALKLDIAHVGQGTFLQFLNQMIWHSNGRVGLGLGTSQVGSDRGIPQALLHLRSTATALAELFRMEGIDDTDRTVAMTFKPRRSLPFFSFIEVDHDNPGAAGDWFMNFVLTADMDTDADGAIGVGTFRWVVGAAGFGVGTEIMRANSLGITMSVNLTGNVVSATRDELRDGRITWTSATTGVGTANPGANDAVVRNSIYAKSGPKAWRRIAITGLGVGNGVTLTTADGIGVSGLQYLSPQPTRIQVFLIGNEMDNTNYAPDVYVMAATYTGTAIEVECTVVSTSEFYMRPKINNVFVNWEDISSVTVVVKVYGTQT